MGPEQSKFAPAIVEFENENGASWIAYVANNESNTLLIIANDGALWAPHTVVNEASKCAPALASFDGKIWMAFVANNDSNALLVTSTGDGVTWTRGAAPNESSKCAPALFDSSDPGFPLQMAF